MDSSSEEPLSPRQAAAVVRANMLWDAIGAALMLYVGFAVRMKGIAESAFYNGSVTLFTRSMQVGGIVMAALAGLRLAGWRWTVIVDGLACGVVGLVLAGVGIVWLVYADMQGILLLVFATTFVWSARSCWQQWQVLSGSAQRRGGFVESLRSPAPPPEVKVDMPKRGEAIPEGYLAKLAGEDDAEKPHD